jgi:hypothetical protein
MDGCLRLHYQRQLIYAGLDDFNPNGVFSGYMGGMDGKRFSEWQRAVVTFLDQGVTGGLLMVSNWGEMFSPDEPIDIEGVLLGNYSRDRFHVDNDIVWNALYFFGTKTLIGDLNRFRLRSWGAMGFSENVDFLKMVQDKYKINFCL